MNDRVKKKREFCERCNVYALNFYISLAGSILSKIDVHNPVFDYIPSDLVNLCISNM